MDKSSVKRSFSRAADTYEASSGVQREVAGLLASLVGSLNGAGSPGSTPAGKRILDIGCGTGTLARLLGGLYPGAIVTGLDLSLKMAGTAATRLASDGLPARLLAADCEALPLASGSVDIAASSLTYQWAPDTRAAFREAARVLKPGGLFCLSTLGPKTLRELDECRAEVFGKERARLVPYKPLEELTSELTGAGFEVLYDEARPVVKRYQDLFALLRTLKNIGAFSRVAPGQYPDGTLARGRLREVAREYAGRFPAPEGGVAATYDVVYMGARKK